MASIGSLSSSTSSLVTGGGGLHGYGGLASGLDRDTLIESMTYATRAKIAKKQQKKQSLEWKQTSYRSVTDKLVALSSKYMDYTNPTSNLSSSALFAKTNITAYGKNSSKVSVTSAGSNSADSLTILGVKQMAQNASYTTGKASDGALTTGVLGADEDVSIFQDQSLTIQYGDKSYTVRFGEIAKGTSSEVAMKLNAALDSVTIEGDKKLSSVVKFQADGDGIILTENNADGKDLTIVEGSQELLEHMGLLKEGEKFADAIRERPESFEINGTGIKVEGDKLYERMSFKDRIAGQSLTFTYNGQSTTIAMPSLEELEKAEKDSNGGVLSLVQKTLQDGFDKAFGAGRIQVDLKDKNGQPATDPTIKEGSFSFKTMLPGQTGKEDDSSSLSLSYGSEGMVGTHRAFHVIAGENNRVNLNVSLGSGATGLKADTKGFTEADFESLEINGKKIEGITKDSTINDIINAINKSDAGVTVSYLQNSDKFVITSTADGASGQVKWNDNKLAEALFGKYEESKVQKGRDAIVTVQYAGSSESVDLYRGTNSFTHDGLNISIKGEFGYEYEKETDGSVKIDANGNKVLANGGKLIQGEEVTFESKANVDNVLSSIKDMVNAYNEIVDMVNGFLTTKPNRDYQPLTDDQKEEMTDEQIEKWEKKAKEGILFGDDLLRELSSDLRFVTMGSLMSKLESIGISEVSDYTANGKLTIDENKLKNALETDPDKVAKIFTSTDKSQPGLMTNMKKITDSYAKTLGTPKGSLIQRAGSESSALSLTDNEIYKELKDIDDLIKQLQTRLKSEQDRYISQFTRLETVIAQMNSQSSYLSSMSGGY